MKLKLSFHALRNKPSLISHRHQTYRASASDRVDALPLVASLPALTNPIRRRVANGIFALLVAGCLEAGAGVMVFSLDPNRSVVELRGTVLAFGLNLVLNDQAPGSRFVPWQGTIVVDASTNSIQFLGGNWMPLMENGSWEPDTNGVPGIAPGNYGLKPAVNLPSIKIEGRAACRQWGFETISTNLPMTNGQFAVRPVTTRFVPAGNSAVDYRFELTINPGDPDVVSDAIEPSAQPKSGSEVEVIAAGRAWMSGMLTNRATAKGQLALEDGIETLTIPLEGWYSFTVTNANYQFRFSIILDGQLVGTRIPIVEYQPPTQPGGPLRISWPPGCRLQRATQLSPPNWTDAAINPPLEISTSQLVEYFRAIRYLSPPGGGSGQ